MKLTRREYEAYASTHQPKSALWRDLVKAFLIGGAICLLGQTLTDGYNALHFAADDASAATSMTLIALSAILTGLGVYDNIAKQAGAGTLVPVTGFANSIASAALEFKSEGYILGMCAKMFVIAGPVLVVGTSASVVYGLVLLFF